MSLDFLCRVGEQPPWFLTVRTGIADPVLDMRLGLAAPQLKLVERRGLVFDLVTNAKTISDAMRDLPAELRDPVRAALDPPPTLSEVQAALRRAGRDKEAEAIDQRAFELGEFEARASGPSLPSGTEVPSSVPLKEQQASSPQSTAPVAAPLARQQDLQAQSVELLSSIDRRLERMASEQVRSTWLLLAAVLLATAAVWLGG